MFIGEFATLTGTTPKTIRFYESIGLLPTAPREGKYRVYDDTYVETVKQIKRAQDLGFKLKELNELIQSVDIKRGLPAAVIISAIIDKREFIQSEIQRLNQMDANLEILLCELNASPCKN